MGNTEHNSKFYQYLGKLFYAVAAADNKIRKPEIEELQKLIEENWLMVEKNEDEFNENIVYQIETVFDWLQDKFLSSEECFKEFEEYYKEYSSLFTPRVKKMTLKTANAIANAFAGLNKSELIIMGKLQLLFSGKLSEPLKY